MTSSVPYNIKKSLFLKKLLDGSREQCYIIINLARKELNYFIHIVPSLEKPLFIERFFFGMIIGR